MATVATFLKPNLKSTYNLWKLLSAGDTVTCYYLYLPKRAANEDYAVSASVVGDTIGNRYNGRTKKDAAQAIATWLNDNVATFTYTVLTLSDFDPAWCGSPDLELIHKASEGSFDKVALYHTAEDFDEDHIQRRKAAAKIFAEEYDFGATQLVYPLLDANLGNVNAVQDLPADLLALINDPWISVRQAYVSGGTSNNEVIAIEKSLHQANNATYCGKEDDGCWFVDGHPQFGSYIECSKTGYNFLTIHPYFKYLTV